MVPSNAGDHDIRISNLPNVMESHDKVRRLTVIPSFIFNRLMGSFRELEIMSTRGLLSLALTWQRPEIYTFILEFSWASRHLL